MIQQAYDVVVVGAGLAGLMAARELKRLRPQANITILEARNRVGGRTETIFDKEVDVGAQWIGPSHEILLGLVKEYNLNLIDQYYPTAGSTRLVECVGYEKVPLTDVEAAEVSKYAELIDRLSKTVSCNAPWDHPEAKTFDRLSIRDHVLASISTEAGRREILLFAQTLLACNPAHVSFLFFLFYVAAGGGMEALGDGDQGAQRWRLEGGMQGLSLKLADDLLKARVTIKLGHKVDSCSLSRGVYTIRAHNEHGNLREFTCGSVIWALSPQLLNQYISFSENLLQSPSLSRKLDLGRKMTPGQAAKVILAFREAFWLQSSGGLNPKCFTDCGLVHNIFASALGDATPALVGLITGQAAVQFTEMSVVERRSAILNQIKQMYPNHVLGSEPIFYAEKLWTCDEYANGCFAGLCPPEGLLLEYGPYLRSSCGDMHFCSTEFASRFYGYMEGALQTGKKAAHDCSITLSK